MSSLAERLEQLTPAKRAIFAKLLEQQTRPTVQPIPRAVHDGAASLSFAQQRLWFLDRLEPGNPFYNISTLARVEGPLDAGVLERCLQTLIARHESLRTTFSEDDGRPVQVIAERLDWKLSFVDLRDLPNSERESRAQELARSEAAKPFDLERGPLLRATLVRLADAEHLLLLTIHHIVGDGWSLGVLRQELAPLYEAIAADRSVSLPPLPIQYADYAIWQREQLAGETLQRQLKYWVERLAGVPTKLDLPTDRPRPAAQSYRGASIRRRLPAHICNSLRSVCRDERVTLFMALLAGFQTLLSRYTGQQDFAVGSPIANRTRPELEGLVGLLANTLVLRSDLRGEPNFRALLQRVRETTLGAYAHQDVPYEKLVETLETERDLSRSPLVQVMFVLQNIPLTVREVAGLRVRDVNFGSGDTSNFDLTLNVDETPDGLDLMLVYSSDLFDAATAERLLSAYETLLAGAVSNPDQRVSRLPLLGDRERREQLDDFNRTYRDFPADRCIHQLFEATAAAAPDSPALRYLGEDIPYAELDRASNRLAHYLLSLGVQPGEPVGLCHGRSPDLITALWAILKAGGVYVPLDPAYPQARIEFMLKDAGVRLVLTEEKLLTRLPIDVTRAIALDSHRAAIAACPHFSPEATVGPDSLAYIIYTSGSTGEPKGVEVAHRGLVNHAIELSRRYGLERGDRLLQYLSLSFDAAGEELFPPLISGATLVLHPAPTELVPSELIRLCGSERINILHLPVLMWHQLVDALADASPQDRPSFRTVLAGGDSLSPEKLRRWWDITGGNVNFLYAYGLTEATITSLLNINPQQATSQQSEDISSPISVGTPIANTSAYILDEQLQPLPAGARGELFIGGVGLAQGYRNRPELTARRFIANPFSAESGARLYRTGDLARFSSDGGIEFLGRIDQQVKVRGCRIELGEIEAALARHANVADVAVVAHGDRVGQKRLIAYFVPATGETPTTTELRSFLKTRLPEQMVPSVYVPLAALPLTATGKLDRRGLPAPDMARPTLDRAYVAPRDERESQLAQIWSGVLGVERIGVHDNFFELGGDSILSIQVVARSNNAGLRITPKQLFQHQTIAELAEVAEAGSSVQAEQGLVTGPVELTPIQRQFFSWDLANARHFNQSALLTVDAGVTPTVIEQSMSHLLRQHDALRLRFSCEQGQWQQTSAGDGDLFRLERIDLSAVPNGEQPAEIERHAALFQASLDLARGPVVRAVLFEAGKRWPAKLLLVIHHLAVDAVSWRVLLEDLQTACAQLISGQPVLLPAKTTSFQHWARRLREHADSSTVQSEMNFWFTPARMRALPLPVDLKGGLNIAGSAQSVKCELSSERTRALLQDVPSVYRTQINDVLLTALAETLSRWTGEQRVLIDLEGHGREPLFDDVDLSRTVGWFTSCYPVQFRVPASESPGVALKSIKEQLRQIPQGGIGYGLMRWLSSDSKIVERLECLPTPGLSFNYLGQFDQLLPANALFSAATEPHGPDRAADQQRSHLLEVVARVSGGRLQVEWQYSANVHRPETIVWLAESYIASLERIVEHCLSPGAGGVTPSDFPLAEVDDQELSKLSQMLAQIDSERR